MTPIPTMAPAEERFLRRWGWLLPVLGAGLLLALSTHGWSWVALDPALARPWLSRAGVVGAGAGALLGLGAWVLWRVTLAWSPGPERAGVLGMTSLAMAVLVLLAGDAAFRSRAGQEPFWLAVRARLRPGNLDYFIRELASLRLSAMERRDDRPGLVLTGSSQLLHGVDRGRLQQDVPERAVLRRSLAGLDPLKACGSRAFFSLRRGDVLVLYVGEMDVGANPGLVTDWIRPLASWNGTRDVAAALGPFARTYRRQLVDLGMASTFETWRGRDYVRHVLYHLARPEGGQQATPQADVIRNQQSGYALAAPDQPFNDVHYRALDRLVRYARGRGAHVVVLEGQVNPVLQTPASMALAAQVRDRVERMADALGFHYVPLSRQTPALLADDWQDGTHVNEAGRVKLTGYVADAVRGLGP